MVGVRGVYTTATKTFQFNFVNKEPNLTEFMLLQIFNDTFLLNDIRNGPMVESLTIICISGSES